MITNNSHYSTCFYNQLRINTPFLSYFNIHKSILKVIDYFLLPPLRLNLFRLIVLTTRIYLMNFSQVKSPLI